jgi:colicin import membrane protein
MAGRMPASGMSPGKQAALDTATEEKLPKWVLVSLLLHGGLILVLFLTPFWPSSRREPPPSYVVDLVGGERIGGRNLGTKIALEAKVKSRPAEPLPQAKSAAPVAPPEPVKKREPKAEKTAKIDKSEKAKAKPAEEVVLAKKKMAASPEDKKKQAAAREPSKVAKDTAKSDDNSLEKVRERLIQSAVERARSRAAAGQESPSGPSSGKSEPLSAGNAEGIGAQSLGKGGVGGEGVLKSVEFIAYQNRLINTIKGNWAWAGRRSDLKVVVQFGIKDNGEIVGLRVTQRSGDATYDESVIRAIRRSSPFSVPPEDYRKEFADIEMIFKPSDFGA